jgi:hypothetical protein
MDLVTIGAALLHWRMRVPCLHDVRALDMALKTKLSRVGTKLILMGGCMGAVTGNTVTFSHWPVNVFAGKLDRLVAGEAQLSRLTLQCETIL